MNIPIEDRKQVSESLNNSEVVAEPIFEIIFIHSKSCIVNVYDSLLVKQCDIKYTIFWSAQGCLIPFGKMLPPSYVDSH